MARYRAESYGVIDLSEQFGSPPGTHSIEIPGGWIEATTGRPYCFLRNGEGVEGEVDRVQAAVLLKVLRSAGVSIRKLGAALVLAVLLGVGLPNMAHAQGCPMPSFWQGDMQGSYVSLQHQMKVDVYRCDMVTLTWRNEYGWHTADYRTVERATAGGVIALTDDGLPGLDNRTVVGVKPAEPGYVQVITSNGNGGYWVYRLEKISDYPVN